MLALFRFVLVHILCLCLTLPSAFAAKTDSTSRTDNLPDHKRTERNNKEVELAEAAGATLAEISESGGVVISRAVLLGGDQTMNFVRQLTRWSQMANFRGALFCSKYLKRVTHESRKRDKYINAGAGGCIAVTTVTMLGSRGAEDVAVFLKGLFGGALDKAPENCVNHCAMVYAANDAGIATGKVMGKLLEKMGDGSEVVSEISFEAADGFCTAGKKIMKWANPFDSAGYIKNSFFRNIPIFLVKAGVTLGFGLAGGIGICAGLGVFGISTWVFGKLLKLYKQGNDENLKAEMEEREEAPGEDASREEIIEHYREEERLKGASIPSDAELAMMMRDPQYAELQQLFFDKLEEAQANPYGVALELGLDSTDFSFKIFDEANPPAYIDDMQPIEYRQNETDFANLKK